MSNPSARLLALLSLLQTRRDWSGELLAERMAVSPRTIRRDVDRLRDLGYRVATLKGPGGGYRLEAGSDLPPLLLDDDQAVAVAVALQIAAVDGAGLGEAVGEAALRALTTVRQVMPARVRHRVDSLPVEVVAPPGRATAADPAVLLALGAAIRAREVLRFDHPAAGDGPARRVEPYHLVTWRGRWYLLAWDLDRDDWRTFRADRITPRVPTGPRFTPRELPGGDVTAYVVSQFRGGDASESGTGWPCRGEVLVDLPLSRVAPFVGDGVAEPADDGRTRLVQGSWSWAALAASLCRFDADLEVVGPSELVAAFGVLAARAGRAAG
ncbi:helix-turn-helix transcriptional regulator [Nocardioides campestrisoli]|uniref:helix-turn-helix transcriptional regulator n=1 Tax=Nocardioides campestrisoli TaxID=2736757 RepID=UPI0015E7D4BD|nr:WYL domain-containing protein [Nocardioides campestrisoli]